MILQGAGLWPFGGDLRTLLSQHQVVIAETYPTEFYGHLDVRFPGGTDGGKRSPTARQAQAAALVHSAEAMGAVLSEEAQRAIESGFGPRPDGEDAFDAMVGLLGMLNVLAGRRSDQPPTDPSVRSVEGWILGQLASPQAAQQIPFPEARGGSPSRPLPRRPIAHSPIDAGPDATCECGCRAAVKPGGHFRPGHDAKLRSQLLKDRRRGEDAAAELARRGWT